MLGRSIGQVAFLVSTILINLPTALAEPQSESATGAGVPRMIAFNGVLREPFGPPLQGVVGVTFAFYRDQEGGSPLWTESQNLNLDEHGRYSVLLGATGADGLPMDLFSWGESRWLGVQPLVAGVQEEARVLLVSVPYALKALDADTFGGKPPSAYVLSRPDDLQRSSLTKEDHTVSAVSGTGTPGALTKWTDSNGALADSIVTEQNGNIGIGTASPAAPLEVAGTSEVLRLNGTGNSMLSLLSSGANRESRGLILDQFGKFYIHNLADNKAEFVIDGKHQIGVGTETPAAPFHIFSSGPAFAHVEGTSATIDVGWLIRNNAPGAKQWAIRSTGDGRMLFRDDSIGAERFTVHPDGSVSIGAANPAAKLDVAGDINIPNTLNSSTGVLKMGGVPFLHNFGSTSLRGNTFVGRNAGNFSSTGFGNTGLGFNVLFNNTSGNSNTAIGENAQFSNTSGVANTAVGDYALYSNSIGSNNTATGASALQSNTTGTGNTATGRNSLLSNQTASVNSAFGSNALFSNHSGAANVAIGADALYSNTNGGSNTAVGTYALYTNNGSANTAVGDRALYFNAFGGGNIAIGDSALYSNTFGNHNVGIGGLYSNLTGDFNTATGAVSLNANTTGNQNTAQGSFALRSNTTGVSNTGIGANALFSNITGHNNTGVGYEAGYTANSVNANTTGSLNTFIGYRSGPGVPFQLNNATAIGANALVSASNSLVLGDSTVNVGVGTTLPTAKLDVNGGVRLNTATAKPGCDNNSRGTFWFTQGGSGVKDTAEVCAKDAADSYAWRALY